MIALPSETTENGSDGLIRRRIARPPERAGAPLRGSGVSDRLVRSPRTSTNDVQADSTKRPSDSSPAGSKRRRSAGSASSSACKRGQWAGGMPDFALGLSMLGELRFLQDDLAGAEKLFRRALAIRGKVIGNQHPDYAVRPGLSRRRPLAPRGYG